MAPFTLDGKTYEYIRQDPGHPPDETSSWDLRELPRNRTAVPLADGDTVTVYALAER